MFIDDAGFAPRSLLCRLFATSKTRHDLSNFQELTCRSLCSNASRAAYCDSNDMMIEDQPTTGYKFQM